ncbi:MAG: glycosyltransferase family 87 protein [Victivallaceae bacterium]|nr:glycosyltransferase family 87 protein [Victivallaceae bacterium]
MPLILSPVVLRGLFFLGLNIATFIALVYIVFRHYQLIPESPWRPKFKNLPYWCVWFAFLQSSPFLMTLRHGQVSSISTFLLFMVLFYPTRNRFNWIWLGLAAAVKYSMLTIIVPILLLQKRWLMGAAALVLFMILVLLPGLWLDGIFATFADYVTMVLNDCKNGANSYHTGLSYSLLNFGFIRCEWFNLLVRALAVSAGGWILWRSRVRLTAQDRGFVPTELKIEEWAYLLSLTLWVSYHRTHDGVIFLPFLGAILLQSLRELHAVAYSSRRIKCNIVISSGLLLFWMIPSSVLYSLSSQFGKAYPALENWVYYGALQSYSMIFPFEKIIFTLMMVYFAYLALSRRNTHQIFCKSTQCQPDC